jgi:integrase
MTTPALALPHPDSPGDPWPGDDILILRGRVVRDGTPAARLSRFADDVWILQPAHPDAHHVVNNVHWRKWPNELVEVFKTVGLAMLDHTYPDDEAIATGCDQLGIDTAGIKLRDLRVFAEWMRDRGLRGLCEVTDRELDAYLAHVLALAKSPGRKASLLGSVRTVWVFREHLPQECRLATTRPWAGASAHSLAGQAPPSRENKTPRISSATMESLLAWSLRMLEVIGPDVRDVWTDYKQLGCDERASPLDGITGRIDGRPWQDHPITISELFDLVRFLAAACFVVVCYLSGARPGEVLNLRRGCRHVDEDTGQLLVTGRRGKGHGRQPTTGEVDTLDRPWVVVEPVHTAIDLLESLSSSPFLFPASLVKTHDRRPSTDHARVSRYMTRDIEQFAAWVNSTFINADGTPAIPPDPTKHIHPSRFRRTLAYFVVRKPRGLIAAALQYGHTSTKVTLSYAGGADSGWMEDLAVERLELVLEQTDRDWSSLTDGEHVSGPSAEEYKTRVTRAVRFAGRIINRVRNVERFMGQADPSIHHGEAMTCVWRAETAACRKNKLELGLPANDAPDESECRSTCQNLAYTDRDIHQLRERLTVLDASATDLLAPRPLRDRAAAQADQARKIIQRHKQSCQTDSVEPQGTAG